MNALGKFKDTIHTEVSKLVENTDEQALIQAADMIWRARERGNRIHITGIGKPSYVAGYMASLFSSVGIPAYFLHGTEAVHGSCGQLETGDVVIAISNSGETAEMKATATAIVNNECELIAVTGNPKSWLAGFAKVHLLARVDEEGGPLNRAPRASIFAELYVLQALSILLQEKRAITAQEYVKRHPGGTLGKLRENEQNEEN